jgi:hypothetical protein
LKDLLFKVAELYYLQTKKISPVPDSCAVSSSALSTNSSVPSPLIARQLQESPVASPPAALSIEKIACLEFLAFMLLSLPRKSYCLQEFIMTRTSGPPSKGMVQAEIACRSERTAELNMMIELFPERRAYYLGLLEAHVETKPPVMTILSSTKRRRHAFIDSDDNEETAATSSILDEFEIAEL